VGRCGLDSCGPGQWRDLVNMVMNLQIPQSGRDFSTS
jgi:hypothetical protein